MPVENRQGLLARFDALPDLLAQEVVREIEEKLRARRTLAPPPSVAPPSPVQFDARRPPCPAPCRGV
jgi:hypothetical protein